MRNTHVGKLIAPCFHLVTDEHISSTPQTLRANWRVTIELGAIRQIHQYICMNLLLNH
jgi:hypothetical protein